MSATAGKNGVVKIGSSVVGELKSWSIEETAKTADTTAMGVDWESHLPTQNSWTGQIDAFWDAEDAGQVALEVGASVVLSFQPEGNSSGDVTRTGTATVTSISSQASHDGVVEASFSVTGNNQLASGTV